MNAQLKFDLNQAIVMRDQGVKQVADHNSHFLEVARNVARQQAMTHGEITSDDVRKHCHLAPAHPNAWGAVFKGPEWVWTGRYRASCAVSRHGGMQRIWRLKCGSSS